MSLTKLIEAVEIANEAAAKLEARKAYPDHAPDIGRAFHGSLDAAKRLHDALLPGWIWRKPAVPWEKDSVAVQSPEWQPADDEEDEGGYPWFKGNAADPARAWLLAILRALEQEGRT